MPRLRNKDAGTGDVRCQKTVQGKSLECFFAGFLTEDGVKWTLWSPVGLTLSAWVRAEAPGRRARMIYDAGGHFQRAVRLAGGHLRK